MDDAVALDSELDTFVLLKGNTRVAVVPCPGADWMSKRPFSAFIRSRILNSPNFEDNSVSAGTAEAVGSKPFSSRTTRHNTPSSIVIRTVAVFIAQCLA